MSELLLDLQASLVALEHQVRALRLRVEAALDQQESGPQAGGSSVAPVLPSAWTSAWGVALAAADSPDKLALLDLTPLDSLTGVNRLDQVGDWTPRLRLARAFRAGFLARQAFLADSTIVPISPDLQIARSVKYHIVLSCPDYPQGFWSTKSRPFFQVVGDPTGRGQYPSPPTSIHHSFHSQLEASAYLLGARRPWPQLEL